MTRAVRTPSPDELLIAARAWRVTDRVFHRGRSWPCSVCGRWHTSAAEARDYHVAEGLEAD